MKFKKTTNRGSKAAPKTPTVDNPIPGPLAQSYVVDPALTFRAKGLLHYVLSRPKGPITSADLAAELLEHSDDNAGSVASGLLELRRAGYMELQRNNKAGVHAGTRLAFAPTKEFVASHGTMVEVED